MDLLKMKSRVISCIPKLRKSKRSKESPLQKTVVEIRREKLKEIRKLRVSWSYNRKRQPIFESISSSYKNIIVVWCHAFDVPRDSAFRLLQTYGEILFIQDRWTDDPNLGKIIWRGALVQFAEYSDAERASTDLPTKLNFIRATMLETTLSNLADCELLHPECGQGGAKVIFERAAPLQVTEVIALRKALKFYGNVGAFSVKSSYTSVNVTCEVTYSHITQAYLAMLMTDGLRFQRGVLTARIEQTEKNVDILHDAKDCMVVLSQCYFPQ